MYGQWVKVYADSCSKFTRLDFGGLVRLDFGGFTHRYSGRRTLVDFSLLTMGQYFVILCITLRGVSCEYQISNGMMAMRSTYN